MPQAADYVLFDQTSLSKVLMQKCAISAMIHMLLKMKPIPQQMHFCIDTSNTTAGQDIVGQFFSLSIHVGLGLIFLMNSSILAITMNCYDDLK